MAPVELSLPRGENLSVTLPSWICRTRVRTRRAGSWWRSHRRRACCPRILDEESPALVVDAGACSFEIDGSLTAMSLLRARPIAYGRGFRKRIFSGTSPRITSSTATEGRSSSSSSASRRAGSPRRTWGRASNGHDDRGFRGASNLWLGGARLSRGPCPARSARRHPRPRSARRRRGRRRGTRPASGPRRGRGRDR